MELQIIRDDLSFNQDFVEYIKSQSAIRDWGKEYFSLAIIGCQSGGKSTLLNKLFNTGFNVMDTKGKRQQTTKGIWLATCQKLRLMIMDIEGADSDERGEQRATFERTTSLFALAMADTLLINMWHTDIGRYQAGSLGLISVIFEVNLKLFGKTQKKKILFVIRDFKDFNKDHETNVTKQKILNDMNTIWSKIMKPNEHQNKMITDFFEFDFKFMPNLEW